MVAPEEADPIGALAVDDRARNALGWSPWSAPSWLATLPSVPAAPPEPRCDPTLTSHDALAIELLEPLTSNGQPVIEYEFMVFAGRTGHGQPPRGALVHSGTRGA